MDEIEEIRKMTGEKKIVMGLDRTLKKLRNGKLEKIFLAFNCPIDVKENIKYYGKLRKIKVIELKINNNELGTICRKPFSISVLCY